MHRLWWSNNKKSLCYVLPFYTFCMFAHAHSTKISTDMNEWINDWILFTYFCNSSFFFTKESTSWPHLTLNSARNKHYHMPIQFRKLNCVWFKIIIIFSQEQLLHNSLERGKEIKQLNKVFPAEASMKICFQINFRCRCTVEPEQIYKFIYA